MKGDTASDSQGAKSSVYKPRLTNRPYLVLSLLVIATVLAYSNTFDSPFHFDDVYNIEQNPLITDISNIPTILFGSKGPFASRPLMHATFNINYYFGGLDTRGYHIVNLCLHLINGLLVYLLVVTTGKLMGYPLRQVNMAAVFASLLFLLHPVQTEGVTYIVSRSSILATMFLMLGLVIYSKAVTADKRKWLYVAALFVVSLLGMGSRENFVTFVPLIIIYDVLFISRFNLKEILRHFRAYLPVILSAGYLVFIVLKNTYDTPQGSFAAGVPHVDYFLTEFKVHWTYLRLLVLPINQSIDYDYPLSGSLSDLPTMLALAGYIGLWAFGVLIARRRPAVAFPLLWFLIVLVPISFLVTFMKLRLDDVIFEHRLYMAVPGLLMLAGAAISFLLGRLDERRQGIAFITVTIGLVAVLSVATYNRNADWASEFTLWGDAAVKSPRKARPFNNLGYSSFAKGRAFEAIELFKKALSRDPDFADAHYNIALAYYEKGLKRNAVEHYQRAVELRPDFAEAQVNLGDIYMDMGMTELAVGRYEAAIREIPRFSRAHLNLGNAYMAMGLYDKAIEHFKTAIDIKPYRVDWYNNLANAYYLNGQVAEADVYFKKALGIQK